MLIEFIHDHRGRETDEKFYKVGEQTELDDAWARLLIDNGRAVEVKHEKTTTTRNNRHSRRRNHKRDQDDPGQAPVGEVVPGDAGKHD